MNTLLLPLSSTHKNISRRKIKGNSPKHTRLFWKKLMHQNQLVNGITFISPSSITSYWAYYHNTQKKNVEDVSSHLNYECNAH